MIRRIARRLRDDQAGISLTELIVTMALTLLIMTMVATMFVQSSRITTASNQTRNSNGVASNVANEITAVLHTAVKLPKLNVITPLPAIVSGTRSSMVLYALSNTTASDPAPVKISFTLDATNTVTEVRCKGTSSNGYWTFDSCATTATRKLGVGVLPPSTTPGHIVDQLFTYYDVNHVAISIGTGSLSDTDRPKVASIGVVVTAQAVGSKTDPVVISNTVVLRNLGLGTTS
jgi:Tfp pilus assembly protein PilW